MECSGYRSRIFWANLVDSRTAYQKRATIAEAEASLYGRLCEGFQMRAMVTVTTAVAIAAYEWLGLEILRRAWINVDMVWTVALAAAGAILLVGS